jgi:sodium/proline symporter
MEAILCFKLSKKIRNMSIETGSLTPVELLSKLRGDPYNLIKVIGGLMISLFVMFYLAGQFVSGAKAATVLGIPYNTAVWVSALVVMAYVFFGGVLAVMWTDAIQGVMMVGTFFLLLITVLVQSGGFFEAFDASSKVAPNNVMWTNGKVGMKLLLPILTWFGVGWCFWGQPQAIQKFLTIKDEKSLPSAAIMSIGFNTIRQYVPIMMGLCGRVLFDNLKDPELLTPTILATYYPNIIGGLALASIFAAIMSTTDSLILQSTSEFTRNVMQLSLFPKASDKTIGYAVKVMTLVVSFCGIYIAMFSSSSSFSMILFAFAGLSAAITGPLWLGFCGINAPAGVFWPVWGLGFPSPCGGLPT